MSEEIKKNEICDGELENVSGGNRIPIIERKGVCPVCGDDMRIHTNIIPWIPISDPASRYSYYCCGTCNYRTYL